MPPQQDKRLLDSIDDLLGFEAHEAGLKDNSQ
jgi:hypothetical protein